MLGVVVEGEVVGRRFGVLEELFEFVDSIYIAYLGQHIHGGLVLRFV